MQVTDANAALTFSSYRVLSCDSVMFFVPSSEPSVLSLVHDLRLSREYSGQTMREACIIRYTLKHFNHQLE